MNHFHHFFSSAVDFISLMAYDLNGAWQNWTGHNSPLYERAEENPENATLNVVSNSYCDRIYKLLLIIKIE